MSKAHTQPKVFTGFKHQSAQKSTTTVDAIIMIIERSFYIRPAGSIANTEAGLSHALTKNYCVGYACPQKWK